MQSTLVWSELSAQERIDALKRPAIADNETLTKTVSDIIRNVRASGDETLFELSKRFDGVELDALLLSDAKKQQALSEVSDEVKASIDLAYDNIRKFHSAQTPSNITVETKPGVICEQKFAPIERVGLYIPGGTAPLPSTVLMLGVCAQVAQCKLPIVASPPNAKGSIAGEIIYAAQKCGICDIYLMGGAQAIAAMAFGTQSVPKVDKIFGPGNSFVTEAKQQVSQTVDGAAIDMPAGPSEVLVLADTSASPSFVASDLLSQAEHGVDSQAVLVSDDRGLIDDVKVEIQQQLATLSRSEIAAKSIANSRFILCKDMDTCIEAVNQYAAEHLIVQTSNDDYALSKLENAGSIFVGPWSPESAGDYASGTNHVLPTYGYARNYSSLGLLDFMRRYTVQTLSKEGLQNIGPAIMHLANAEGLDAHRQAVAIRLDALTHSSRDNAKDGLTDSSGDNS